MVACKLFQTAGLSEREWHLGDCNENAEAYVIIFSNTSPMSKNCLVLRDVKPGFIGNSITINVMDFQNPMTGQTEIFEI